MIRALILAASAMALAMGVAAQSREPASPTARVTAANRAALREPSSAGYIYGHLEQWGFRLTLAA